jgi:hypothetical protein
MIRFTFPPAFSTTPDKTSPSIDFRGFIKPSATRAEIHCDTGNLNPLIMQSLAVTEVETIFISTSLIPGEGFITSLITKVGCILILTHATRAHKKVAYNHANQRKKKRKCG